MEIETNWRKLPISSNCFNQSPIVLFPPFVSLFLGPENETIGGGDNMFFPGFFNFAMFCDWFRLYSIVIFSKHLVMLQYQRAENLATKQMIWQQNGLDCIFPFFRVKMLSTKRTWKWQSNKDPLTFSSPEKVTKMSGDSNSKKNTKNCQSKMKTAPARYGFDRGLEWTRR